MRPAFGEINCAQQKFDDVWKNKVKSEIRSKVFQIMSWEYGDTKKKKKSLIFLLVPKCHKIIPMDTTSVVLHLSNWSSTSMFRFWTISVTFPTWARKWNIGKGQENNKTNFDLVKVYFGSLCNCFKIIL